MKRELSVVIPALLLTIVSGMAYRGTHPRWTADQLAHAQSLLDQLPAELGDWVRIGSPPVSADALQMLECQVHVNQTYRHRQSGKAVTCTILLAPAGPLSVHAAEVCYASDNYEVVVPRQRVAVGGHEPNSEFWKVLLRPESSESKTLSVFYGWHPTRQPTDARGWVAPDKERYYFAGAGMLYKLQLAWFNDGAADEAGDEFLKSFLPALETCLIGNTGA